MKKIEIIPYVGFDIFKLGMHKSDINNILGEKYNHIKYDYTTDLLDDYYEDGILIDYNEKEICISAHLSEISEGIYNGRNLFNVKYDEIWNIFSNETNAYIQENNLLFLDTGIGFSFKEDDNVNSQRPLLITVFAKELFTPFLKDYEKISPPQP
jgi:hypothetical protein